MSDADDEVEETSIEALAKEVIANLKLTSAAWADADFYPSELLNKDDYHISQSHLVQDMAFKVNNRESKLNKKLKRGTIYGLD